MRVGGVGPDRVTAVGLGVVLTEGLALDTTTLSPVLLVSETLLLALSPP